MGQVLHFLSFTDTNDKFVGESAQAAYIYFSKVLLPEIKQATGLNLNNIFCYGENFRKSKLDSICDNLSTRLDDVIFFYFVGHGYNDGSDDYPMLALDSPRKSLSSRSHSLSEIYHRLKNKPHRLLVVVAEACNTFVNVGKEDAVGSSKVNYFEENCKYLFEKATGDILVSSSRKGQKSYGTNDDLGFFTRSFMEVIGGNQLYTNWNDFLTQVARKTEFKIKSRTKYLQQPQWIVSKSSNAASTQKGVPLYGTSRAFKDTSKGLPYITNNIKKWNECRTVSIADGIGIAIYGLNGYTYTGIPPTSTIVKKLDNINKAKKRISDVVISSGGKYYCIIYGRNGYEGSVPSNGMANKLKQFASDNEEILSVSISDDGKCAVVTDKHFWSSDDRSLKVMKMAMKRYGDINSVCITKLGITIVCEEGVYCENVPENLMRELQDLKFHPKVIKFTDNGRFFISDGIKVCRYRM